MYRWRWETPQAPERRNLSRHSATWRLGRSPVQILEALHDLSHDRSRSCAWTLFTQASAARRSSR